MENTSNHAESATPRIDVAVIGGSIAGAFSAYLLGMAGLRVTLFDRKSFPRRKTCGEGLAAAGKRFLRHYGLWSAEFEAHTSSLRGYQLRDASGRQVTLNLGDGDTTGVSRYLLDFQIRQSALSHESVSAVQSTVRSVKRRADGLWEIHNHGQAYCADHLILATGGSKIPGYSFPAAYPSAVPARLGYAAWLQGAWRRKPADYVLIRHDSEGELFATPLGKNFLNVSLLCSQKTGRTLKRRDFLALTERFAAEIGFESLYPVEVSACCNIQQSAGSLQDSGIYLIGDALERFDPVSGLGMTHALCSAERAARAIILHRRGNLRAWRQYKQSMQRSALSFRVISSVAYKVNVLRSGVLFHTCFSTPRLASLALQLLKFSLPRPCASREFFQSGLMDRPGLPISSTSESLVLLQGETAT